MSIFDALRTEDPKIGQFLGVAAAIVTNNKDPKGQGRVKVTFPWFSDDNETDWIRIATLMAGSARGTFFLPEVDDEVLVAFGHGNFNLPYVIGAIWNGVDKPPETNSDGQNNIRKISSRSGHELIFNDNGRLGQEKVEIHTNGGHKIVLDDSLGGEKIEIVDQTGSNSIVVDTVQNSVTVSASLRLTIKAAVIEIEADSMMTLKAGGVLTIQGSLVKIN
jgi:uncharacterized protein involved in type VI secretion and phage assembly